MKIISLDIETTGLDESVCQILQIGAIMFDSTLGIEQFEDCKTWSCIIDNGEHITGSPYALNMNRGLLEVLAKLETIPDRDKRQHYRAEANILSQGQVADSFYKWLLDCGIEVDVTSKSDKIYINACGKNLPSFDIPFLNKHIPNWKSRIKIRRRIADPAILYVEDMDDAIPSLSICMQRAGMAGEVPHCALDDAIITAKLIIIGLQRRK